MGRLRFISCHQQDWDKTVTKTKKEEEDDDE